MKPYFLPAAPALLLRLLLLGLLLLAPLPQRVLAQDASAAPQATPPQATPPQSTPIVRRTPDIPTIHIESRLVSVALNVTDEHGAPVPGLTAADFTLAEDGKTQRIAVFDTESSTPLEIVLTLDASGSVEMDDRLEHDAAKIFARSLLRPQDRIDLMSFSDQVSEVVPFTSSLKRFDNGLGRIERGDATAMYDAVYLAAQRLAQTDDTHGQRRVIVLITDGENTIGHGDYPMALAEAQRAGAAIYSLIIVPVEADAGRDTGGEHALIQLAKDTGGKYFYVEDQRDLAPAFQHLSDTLRTQYTVGYYAPPKGVGQGDLRHIQLQLKDPALRARYTLRYRTAYYADR